VINKLRAIKEGDGTLLDNCMIVYGGGLADGDRHEHQNLPILLAGRGGGRALDHADHALVVPAVETARIQEVHLLFLHLLSEQVDAWAASA
jgi:hypothetical protein